MHVIIMSGVSGSGKSTYVHEHFPDAMVCSADHHFMKNGEYNFNPSLLGEAHKMCIQRFTMGLIDPENPYTDTIVVDNTNTTSEEIAPYYALGSTFAEKVELITLIPYDPNTCFIRNKHGVPLPAILGMHERLLNRKLPPFWEMKQTTIMVR